MFTSEHDAISNANPGDAIVPVMKSGSMVNGQRGRAFGYKVTSDRDQLRAVFLPNFRDVDALERAFDEVLGAGAPMLMNKETFEPFYMRHRQKPADVRDFTADRHACDVVISEWFADCDLVAFPVAQ